jgi:hypothetical protein
VTDPQREGFVVTSSMIGATLGVLLLVFVAVISTAVIVKFFVKRKRREKSIRFGKDVVHLNSINIQNYPDGELPLSVRLLNFASIGLRNKLPAS